MTLLEHEQIVDEASRVAFLKGFVVGAIFMLGVAFLVFTIVS